MRVWALVLLVLAIFVNAAAWADAHESALLSAILDLGRLNGEALACDDQAAAARAKALILAYAPKVRRYGAAYEQGTQDAFSEHVRNGSQCRTAVQLAGEVERAGVMLRLNAERDAVAGTDSQ